MKCEVKHNGGMGMVHLWLGPYELLTCGLLPLPILTCFDLRSPALGWLSKYHEYTVAKQNGGGAEWVELFIMLTRGIREPTYGLFLSLITSWWGVCEACSAHPVLKVLSLDTRGLYSGDSHGKYIILCESHSQRALNGSVLFLVTAYLT